MTLAVTRRHDKPEFSQSELCAWTALSKHLACVVRLLIRTAQARLGVGSAFAALDALGIGIAMISQTSRLLFASRPAEAVFARAEGLSVSQGCLRVPPSMRARFEARLREMAAGSKKEKEVMIIPCTNGTDAISMLMTPAHDEWLSLPVGGGRSVALIIHDPRHRLNLREEHLTIAYGLTKAEARLLHELVTGVPLVEYAAATGIALNTAKTYLHQVLIKTGQTRQADLVREVLSDLVLRIAGNEFPEGPSLTRQFA